MLLVEDNPSDADLVLAELRSSGFEPDSQRVDSESDYLAHLYAKYDDLSVALTAYNAGEGSVARHGGVPPFRETRTYVQRVLNYYERYGGSVP